MTALIADPILMSPAMEQVDINLTHDPDDIALRTQRAMELPDPTAICCTVAHAAVETFHGARSITQLARLVSPAVYEQLAARSRTQQQLGRINGHTNAVTANALGRRTKASQRPTTRILRARVLRVSPIAAEATVIIQDGDRVRAAAIRVEEFRGRWRANVLQIG